MSEYPKLIENKYWVWAGGYEYYSLSQEEAVTTGIHWEFKRAFKLASDASAYAERIAEDHQIVKIEKRGYENG